MRASRSLIYLTILTLSVSSFGEDAGGEMYIVDHAGFASGAGEVYRIVLE